MDEIRRDRYLKPSTPHYSRNIGKGIYVTTMDPFTNSRWDLRWELFLGSNSSATSCKLLCYFALNKYDVMTACSLVQQYPGRPNCIRLVPKNDKLYLSDVSHYSGRTNFAEGACFSYSHLDYDSADSTEYREPGGVKDVWYYDDIDYSP